MGGPAFSVMDMVNYRNLLDPDEMFGTRSCRRGFEGTVNETYDRYMSCHMLKNSLELRGVDANVAHGHLHVHRYGDGDLLLHPAKDETEVPPREDRAPAVAPLVRGVRAELAAGGRVQGYVE